jgi:hypothetical protein
MNYASVQAAALGVPGRNLRLASTTLQCQAADSTRRWYGVC